MAQSRMHYLRKLSESFPDQPSRSYYPLRDIIAPRFMRPVVGDLRNAVLRHEIDAAHTARHDLRIIAKLCNPLYGFVLRSIEVASRNYLATRLADYVLRVSRNSILSKIIAV